MDDFVQRLCSSPIFTELDALAFQTAGIRLIILIPGSDHGLDIFAPAGGKASPDFCSMFKSTPAGRHRCSTCRSLVAFAACNRGVVEHTCHGGLYILAAPALPASWPGNRVPVVSSCAFIKKEKPLSLSSVRKHMRDVDVPWESLQKTYRKMQILDRKGRRLAEQFVRLAAGILAAWSSLASSPGNSLSHGQGLTKVPVMEQKISMALQSSENRSWSRIDQTTSGGGLVDVIAGVVDRNAAAPFRLVEIARAAGITPNYLSALFHQYTGQSFKNFVTRRRIEQAKLELKDLTMNIGEVAAKVGYDDPNYFSRQFRKITGKTPGQWRRQPLLQKV